VNNFWATGFWATGFWATDFWVGDDSVSGPSRKPGFQDTSGTRNKRENRYGLNGLRNDTAYRLGDNDVPKTDTADNKNRNRFT